MTSLAGVGEGSRHLWDRPRGVSAEAASEILQTTKTEAKKLFAGFRKAFGEIQDQKVRGGIRFSHVLTLAAALVTSTLVVEHQGSHNQTVAHGANIETLNTGSTLEPVRAYPLPPISEPVASIATETRGVITLDDAPEIPVQEEAGSEGLVLLNENVETPNADAAATPIVLLSGESVVQAADGSFFVMEGITLRPVTNAEREEIANQAVK